MLKYKLVIFDFDGTLADSFATFLEVWEVAAGRHGFRAASQCDLQRLRGCGAREIIAEAGVPWWKLPLVARHMQELMRERIAGVGLFDGIETVLRTLKAAGIQVAIVTSNSRANVELVLGAGRLGLIDHFGCGASLFGKRPKTRAVIKAAGVSPADVLCVGDEIRDAEAADELGLDFAAVSWGYTYPERLEGLPGVRMCRSADELLSLVIAG